MVARLRVIAGRDERAPKWWQKQVERRHLVGGAIMLGAAALGVWMFVDPTMGGRSLWLLPLLLLALVLTVPGIRQEIAKPAPAEHYDQRVLHVHVRRGWWR